MQDTQTDDVDVVRVVHTPIFGTENDSGHFRPLMKEADLTQDMNFLEYHMRGFFPHQKEKACVELVPAAEHLHSLLLNLSESDSMQKLRPKLISCEKRFVELISKICKHTKIQKYLRSDQVKLSQVELQTKLANIISQVSFQEFCKSLGNSVQTDLESAIFLQRYMCTLQETKNKMELALEEKRTRYLRSI